MAVAAAVATTICCTGASGTQRGLASMRLQTVRICGCYGNAMNATHQPGEDQVKAILPEQIEWRSFAAFPPTVRLAVLVGDPSSSGAYATRVKAPLEAKTMPHRHPEDRVYTVISGIFYVGFGETFDGDRLTAYPPGAVFVLPSGTWHFHWAKSCEYIVQVNAIGPLGMEYANSADDPRAHK